MPNLKSFQWKSGLLAVSLAATMGMSGCEGIAEIIEGLVEDPGDAGFTLNPLDDSITFTGSVRVVDEDRMPLTSAKVEFNDQTMTADDEGIIRIVDLVITEAPSIKIKASGFMGYPVKLDYSYVGQDIPTIQMEPVEFTATISASVGGELNTDHVGLTFSADAFVDADGKAYDGDVVIKIASVNIDSEVISGLTEDGNPKLDPGISTDQLPRGYLLMTDGKGNVSSTLPQSIIVVELEDEDGNPLQLGDGKTAEIRLGLPQITDKLPGDTMILSSYDEELGMWTQDGTCTVSVIPDERKTSSSVLECIGEVSHFTRYSASNASGTPRCIQFHVTFDEALKAKFTESTYTNRTQFIEYLDTVRYGETEEPEVRTFKDATFSEGKKVTISGGGSAVDEADVELKTSSENVLAQCMIGYNSLQWSRIKVLYVDKASGKSLGLTSEWVRPNVKKIASTDLKVACQTCEVYSVNLTIDDEIEFVDNDGDGWSVAHGDCNDDADDPVASFVYPGAPESICSTIDYNCDGTKWTKALAVPDKTDSIAVARWNNKICPYMRDSNRANKNCATLGTDSATNDNGIDEDCNGTSAVNQCDRANSDLNITCDTNATCSDSNVNKVNTAASLCTCNEGYVGDGVTCSEVEDETFEITISEYIAQESSNVGIYVEVLPDGLDSYLFDCDNDGSFEQENGTTNDYVCMIGPVDGPTTTVVGARATSGAMVAETTAVIAITDVAPSLVGVLEPMSVPTSDTVASVEVTYTAVTDGVDDWGTIEIDCDGTEDSTQGFVNTTISNGGTSENHTCNYAPPLEPGTSVDVSFRLTDEDGDQRIETSGFFVDFDGGGGGEECPPICGP